MAITGPLDLLPAFAPGKVIMRHDWNRAWKGFDCGHGSVFRFAPGLHGWLYETLAADPTGETERVGGEEQLYTSSVAQRHGAFAYIPPDWIASFKRDCRQSPRKPVPANQITGKRPRRPLSWPAEQSRGGGGIPQDLEDLAEKKQALRLGKGALDRQGRGGSGSRLGLSGAEWRRLDMPIARA